MSTSAATQVLCCELCRVFAVAIVWKATMSQLWQQFLLTLYTNTLCFSCFARVCIFVRLYASCFVFCVFLSYLTEHACRAGSLRLPEEVMEQLAPHGLVLLTYRLSAGVSSVCRIAVITSEAGLLPEGREAGSNVLTGCLSWHGL